VAHPRFARCRPRIPSGVRLGFTVSC
jgi:hypothetical protein